MQQYVGLRSYLTESIIDNVLHIEHNDNERFVCREKYGDKLESNEDLRLVISRVSLSCVDQVCSNSLVSLYTFYVLSVYLSPSKLRNI